MDEIGDVMGRLLEELREAGLEAEKEVKEGREKWGVWYDVKATFLYFIPTCIVLYWVMSFIMKG